MHGRDEANALTLEEILLGEFDGGIIFLRSFEIEKA